jgi:hypothetical protein
MAPQKCNFLIFSKNSESESNKLDLRLFGEKLCVNESPTFLGIRFDRHLTFKNQISYLQDSCVNRLNFLKIVSKRSFGLSSDTLNSLYISIIRSVLEYSSIITPNMATSSFNKLAIIQNKAIKIINHQPIHTSIEEINTNFANLIDRFDHLNKRYIIQAILNNNDLITDLWNEYLDYSANHPMCKITVELWRRQDRYQRLNKIFMLMLRV